ncbi:hypothetical protein PNK_1525 [Candidatus Protochlamydia naegleriophila]|uniref:Uncharacterized protein n=1 Tax=Candidatus Protochlamydia naegleriophila TaxID=389348 RepID=A0A0U5JFG6_9BACT|nr:hypothetical protein [Candidatus Protochlamydia naegleriophila]CUI17135.1 hypothetical protein PNK_1525 [Candidatus Protochlamydia naegleriophila]
MSQDFIQLPELAEIQEDLNLAKQDIEAAVQEDSSLESLGAFVVEVINIIEGKAAAVKGNLDMKSKVDLAAHLTLLNSLMDEIFLANMEDELEFEEEEEEDTEEKR